MPLLANPRLRLPILLLVAIAARALTFGNPLVHVDEEFYFVTAHRMWQGALPFVDIWDRKPVGLFLLYAVPAALGFPAGIWGYQALALAGTVATAWGIARLAERLGFGAGATAGALAYILWLDLLGGQSGQSPVFYNLLMLAAALLALRPPPHCSRCARRRSAPRTACWSWRWSASPCRSNIRWCSKASSSACGSSPIAGTRRAGRCE